METTTYDCAYWLPPVGLRPIEATDWAIGYIYFWAALESVAI